MKVYAVVDTNVVVSGMITHNTQSPVRAVLELVSGGRIVPLLNEEILFEYRDVLLRPKFGLSADEVMDVLGIFSARGVSCARVSSGVVLPDPDDQVFYETYKAYEGAYLVTGNRRHFPAEGRIVSPGDVVDIVESVGIRGKVLSEPMSDYMSAEKRKAMEKARLALERIREKAAASGVADLTMEEIDEEIRKSRRGIR